MVEFGTARRAFQSVKDLDGTILPVAGKTGTGDNRVKTFATVGKARNRTATFVFTVGDRYFGTVVAYVPGEEAGVSVFLTQYQHIDLGITLVPNSSNNSLDLSFRFHADASGNPVVTVPNQIYPNGFK